MIKFEAFMNQDGSFSLNDTRKETKEAKAIENIVRQIYAGYDPKSVVANRLNSLEELMNKPEIKFVPEEISLVCNYKVLMDPLLWEDVLFIPDQIHGLKKDDQPFMGTRIIYDENGKPYRDKNGKIETMEIQPEEASDDDIKNTIIKNFINPAGRRLALIVSCTDIRSFEKTNPKFFRVLNNLETKLCSWNLTSVKTWYPLVKCPYKN